MNREPIYQALFTLASGSASFLTKSRRLRHWSEVSPSEMPALFMTQKTESAKTQTGLPTIWTLSVDLYLYVESADVNVAPATLLNPLLDAITNLFDPPAQSGRQTLGGLVQYCRVNGNIETDEGILGNMAVAIIPIEVLTA